MFTASPLASPARPRVKLKGLSKFAELNQEFNAKNERQTITASASKLMDLMFIADRSLSPSERISELEAHVELITSAITQLKINN